MCYKYSIFTTLQVAEAWQATALGNLYSVHAKLLMYHLNFYDHQNTYRSYFDSTDRHVSYFSYIWIRELTKLEMLSIF